jgi:hypothetical protein
VRHLMRMTSSETRRRYHAAAAAASQISKSQTSCAAALGACVSSMYDSSRPKDSVLRSAAHVWVSTLTIWHKSRGTIPHRMRALMGGELHGP